MKISKLFHWLYAILMLLPFAFFVPSVFYYAFNDNATMQTVEVPKTETIAVDFNQKFKSEGGSWSNARSSTTYQNGLIHFEVSSGGMYNAGVFFNSESSYNVSFEEGHYYYPRLTLVNGTIAINTNLFLFPSYMNINEICLVSSSNSSGLHYYNTEVTENVDIQFYFNVFDLTQMFGSGNEPTKAQFDEWFPNPYYPFVDSELRQITYDTGETEQLVQNTDIVNYAWESIWNLPLFSWSKVSFVAVPFTYITGLFGLAPSNSFNYVFTYFASMSIIWLVFDVVLYVPLLVHRWLDKGIVE